MCSLNLGFVILMSVWILGYYIILFTSFKPLFYISTLLESILRVLQIE